MFFSSPFEQFIITPLISAPGMYLDFTITNITLGLAAILSVGVYAFLCVLKPTTSALYAHPTHLEGVLHLAYLACQSFLDQHLNVMYYRQYFFPLIFAMMVFLLGLNLGGLIPFGVSVTSQVVGLCAYIVPIIIGIFIWALYERNVTFIRTFNAPGTSGYLSMVLLPVELITYIMRPVSLIARLFSNFMSGHVIVKVLLGSLISFAKVKVSTSIFFSLLATVFLLGMTPLIVLEIAICGIQVYVFIVVFCMFLSDTFGHHYRH